MTEMRVAWQDDEAGLRLCVPVDRRLFASSKRPVSIRMERLGHDAMGSPVWRAIGCWQRWRKATRDAVAR